MTGSADAFDAYKVLQVDPEAEDEVLEAAYRRLARKYHPDVTDAPDAADRMVALNRAWDLVGDARRRGAYDTQRSGVTRPSAGFGARTPAPRPTAPSAEPASRSQRETVSRDWTAGRSFSGGGYDPASMRTAEGTGAAGRPPGNPSGSVVRFGRYDGWSLGEIARRDIEYLEWLDRMPIGRPFRAEIDALLRHAGRRRSAAAEASGRRGLFRRG